MKNKRELIERVEKNKLIYEQTKDEFFKVFKISLSQFFNPIIGFDVIKFDVFIKTPDGVSTSQYVEKKYGYEGLTILKKILKGEQQ